MRIGNDNYRTMKKNGTAVGLGSSEGPWKRYWHKKQSVSNR